MGSRLCAAALGQPAISVRARVVLARMAIVAKDADHPPIYFGGWPFLAAPLGFTTYTPAAKLAVARAVRELLVVGLIKSYGAPGPGHNVTYQLLL
jgi:hypothetical protein